MTTDRSSWTERPNGAIDPTAEIIARAFHEAYEDLAPRFSYETRRESAKPWAEVPRANRLLMMATVHRLILQGSIDPGPRSQCALDEAPELIEARADVERVARLRDALDEEDNDRG